MIDYIKYYQLCLNYIKVFGKFTFRSTNIRLDYVKLNYIELSNVKLNNISKLSSQTSVNFKSSFLLI